VNAGGDRDAQEEIEMNDFDKPQVHPDRLMIGAAVMVLGVVSLLVRLKVLWHWTLGVYFPLFLVVFGVTRIAWPSRPGREVGSMWIALAGGLLLFDRLDIMKMGESWPLVVVMAGLTLVFKALGWLPDREEWREDRSDRREVGL
jgi:hypothetical protein